MELHNKQKEVINSNSRYKILNWGRRCGKTTVMGFEIFITLWNTDNALVSYYAPTLSDARDIAWEMFKEVLEPITIKTNGVLLEITVKNKYGGQSILRMSGWEAVKNRDKGRGVENDLVILDEVAFYPMFKEKFEKVIQPTLLTSKGKLIVTSTPNGFNHFYLMVKDSKKSDDWFYSHATSYDNPFNDPKELDKLKETMDADAFAQEYLADFRKVQGLVYKEFDIERHIYQNQPQNVKERIVGLDWGFTNPTAMLEILVTNDDAFYIKQEYYKTDKTTDEIASMLKTWTPDIVYPDPAEPDRIKILRDNGFYVREVNKDIKLGVDHVRQLFRLNKVFIHESCLNLIEEIQQYRYPDNGQSDKPIKENDHAMDALRYALFMHKPNERAFLQAQTERFSINKNRSSMNSAR